VGNFAKKDKKQNVCGDDFFPVSYSFCLFVIHETGTEMVVVATVLIYCHLVHLVSTVILMYTAGWLSGSHQSEISFGGRLVLFLQI